MGVNAWCSVADLASFGVNAVALVNVSVPDQQASCDAANDDADSYMRGRFPVDTAAISWGSDLRLHSARMAAEIVMSKRGYRPTAGADEVIRENAEHARVWFRGIQTQSVHPNVVFPIQIPPSYQVPQVLTHPKRGWEGRH